MTRNKRILIVTECFYPEEFKINDVAISWKEQGYDVYVLTLVPTYPISRVFSGYKNRIFQIGNYQGIVTYRILAVTNYKNSEIKKILRYVNFMIFGSVFSIVFGRRYDYIFGYNLGSLTDMLPVALINKLYKKPSTIWVQDVWPDSVYAYGYKKTTFLSYVLNVLVGFVYRNCTSIAISSKGFESKLKSFVPTKKMYYAPNWPDDLDVYSISESVEWKKNTTHFTFAGNIGKVQNLENIIKAFSLLSQEFQERSQLNIIGDGSNLDELKLSAKGSSNIVFHGKKSRESMAGYYNASDFLIVSLIKKSIFSLTVPAKVQTYIAAKKPIIAAITGEASKIIKDNNLGFVADPDDVDKMTDIFKECITLSKEGRREMVVNNDKLLNETFSKIKVIDTLTKCLLSRES